MKTLFSAFFAASSFALAAPAHAGLECRYYGSAYGCHGNGTYFITSPDGWRIEGQCTSGARYSSMIPFAVANSLHRAVCGVDLQMPRIY